MTIFLNDKPHEIADGTTLAALLSGLGIGPAGVAVAIGGEVVSKDKWAVTELSNELDIMLITAVSGG